MTMHDTTMNTQCTSSELVSVDPTLPPLAGRDSRSDACCARVSRLISFDALRLRRGLLITPPVVPGASVPVGKPFLESSGGGVQGSVAPGDCPSLDRRRERRGRTPEEAPAAALAGLEHNTLSGDSSTVADESLDWTSASCCCCCCGPTLPVDWAFSF